MCNIQDRDSTKLFLVLSFPAFQYFPVNSPGFFFSFGPSPPMMMTGFDDIGPPMGRAGIAGGRRRGGMLSKSMMPIWEARAFS